jgi:hypothetical protein
MTSDDDRWCLSVLYVIVTVCRYCSRDSDQPHSAVAVVRDPVWNVSIYCKNDCRNTVVAC